VLILPLGFPEVPEEIYLNIDSACDTSGALSGNGSLHGKVNDLVSPRGVKE
jgi:hypothetical protein